MSAQPPTVSAQPPTRSSLSSPWPSTARWSSRGLEIGGIPAVELAERFGTPLLVLDAVHVRERADEFRRSFPQVHYAVKALTSRRLLRLLTGEGLCLLAASRGELEACLRADVPPARLALHGNNKGDAELERAIGAGVGLLICDNLGDVARADAVAHRLRRRQDVLLRLVPGVTAGGHRFIVTGETDSKFGLSIESGDAAAAALGVVESRALRFRGLHAHIGSQVLEIEPYLRSIDNLAAFAGRLARELAIDTELLDIGGGFGITYRDEEPPAVSILARQITSRLRSACAAERIPVPRLLVEPGRALVGSAGITLYRVGSVKAAGGRRLLAVDGGMSDNPRPMLYGAGYEILPAASSHGAPPVPTAVVGQHCESGDVVADNIPLSSSITTGDVLAVAGTGAYCYSLASNYNRTPRPALVALRDGEAELWLRGETYDDLDRLEVIEQPANGDPTSSAGVECMCDSAV